MRKLMKSIFLMIIAIQLVSCSSALKQPEADKEKTGTVQRQADTTQTPYNGFASEYTAIPAPMPETTGLTDNNTLASFSTEILDTHKERVDNIKLACAYLDGYTVIPGETFSFNGALGKRKPEKGYKKAKILRNGKPDYGTGGGICQLSSTLFNAADKAGMEIVERHSHSEEIFYLPLGRDATVVYGGADFKFKNNKSYTVVITCEVRNGRVYTAISKLS